MIVYTLFSAGQCNWSFNTVYVSTKYHKKCWRNEVWLEDIVGQIGINIWLGFGFYIYCSSHKVTHHINAHLYPFHRWIWSWNKWLWMLVLWAQSTANFKACMLQSVCTFIWSVFVYSSCGFKVTVQRQAKQTCKNSYVGKQNK